MTEPYLRDQLSRALCLHVMIPDAPSEAEVRAAEGFVQALGGAPHALAQMRAGYDQRMALLRLDAVRTSFMGDSMKRLVRDGGVLAGVSNLGEVLGLHENPAIAARYRTLGELPEGTLGRALHAFYTSRGFAFPREKHGAPESIIAHDLTHVLTGWNTDLPSEACVTAFQAGYRKEGPFAGLLFVLMNMEKGVTMTRLAPGVKHMFGEPGMAERIVSAWRAGTQVTLDLVADWDYWADMKRPLAEVRSGYGVVVS